MNQEVNVDNNKKKLKLYYGLLVTVLCIIGVSFAWFRLYLSQTENNTIASRTCFNTTLTEDTSKISLTDAFPITDEDGLKQAPFTFTIKNNCNSYVKAYITIDSTYRESTDTSYLKDNYMKVNISPKDTTTNKSVILANQTLTDLESNRKGYIIVNTGLKANEEKSYDLRIWMDSATTLEQGLNKNWAGKIVVVSDAAVYQPTFVDIILENNKVETPLTTPGKEVSPYTLDDAEIETNTFAETDVYVTYGTGWEANGTKFNLTGTAVTSDTYANSYSSLVGKYLSVMGPVIGSSTAGTMATTTNLKSVYYVVSATSRTLTYKKLSSNKNVSEALLASTEDDYGTSYYFRGAVKNNYVQFANKCWRIVRINGDGSVKLILHNDNMSNVSNPCSSLNNSYGASSAHYNGKPYQSHFNDNYDDNAYVGFMYGTPGASDYASTHANVNKSTILTNLETWYANNLTLYESKLANITWCNDKSVITDTKFDPEEYYPDGLGYGTSSTYYSADKRLLNADESAGGTGPSLKCNGELSKITGKIGLLTADEVAFAGYAYRLSTYGGTYLQENSGSMYWWTMTPSAFCDSTTEIWLFGGEDGFFSFLSGATDGITIRPTISLVSDIKISGGTGTSEDPYVID